MKPDLSNLSLARFILLWGLFSTLVLASVSVFMGLREAELRVWEEAEKIGKTEVVEVSLIAERTLQKDEALLREFIVHTVSDGRIERTLIVDPDKQIRMASEDAFRGIPLSGATFITPRLMQDLTGKGPLVSSRDKTHHRLLFAQSFVWPPKPGEIRSGQIGYAVVSVDVTSSLASVRNALLWDEAKHALVFLIMTLLLFALFYLWVKKPLSQLTLASEHFRSGDLRSRVDNVGITELRELSIGFNTMADEIESMISQIRGSESQLTDLIEHSPIGIVAFSGVRMIYVNAEFVRLTGIAEADWLQCTPEAFNARLNSLQAEADPAMLTLKKAADTGGRVSSEVIEIPKPKRLVLARTTVSLDRGSISQVVYFQDITSLTLLDRMKSEFMSVAAHELRTPMAIIMGYAELLKLKRHDKQTRELMIDSIHMQSQSINNLLDELLDLARIEAGAGKVFNFKSGEIATLIEDVCSTFIMQGDPRKVALAPLPPLPPLILDRQKMSQAIKNCLSNAFKYSSPDSPVEVSAEVDRSRQEAFLAIRIRDYGIGMTQEQLSHIYERFWRANTSGQIPGTGLGMSLVKEIMEHHGGRVEVESRFQSGTTVSLFLPIPNQDLLPD